MPPGAPVVNAYLLVLTAFLAADSATCSATAVFVGAAFFLVQRSPEPQPPRIDSAPQASDWRAR